MAIPIESEVREVLTTEREEKIDRSYTRAVNDWMGNNDRPKLSRWPRTRATNIFEYVTNHLIDEFASDSGARFIWHTETFKLILDEKLLVRFKKANRKGVGSNIGTQAEIGFCDPQMELPDMPGLQRVEVDYKLNITGTVLDEINVVARNGEVRLWGYPIAGNGGAELVQFSPPQAPAPTVDDMVRPRKSKKDEKLKKDGKPKKGK